MDGVCSSARAALLEILQDLLLCSERIEEGWADAYLIIVADAADAVSVNFSGWCKFLQI